MMQMGNSRFARVDLGALFDEVFVQVSLQLSDEHFSADSWNSLLNLFSEAFECLNCDTPINIEVLDNRLADLHALLLGFCYHHTDRLGCSIPLNAIRGLSRLLVDSCLAVSNRDSSVEKLDGFVTMLLACVTGQDDCLSRSVAVECIVSLIRGLACGELKDGSLSLPLLNRTVSSILDYLAADVENSTVGLRLAIGVASTLKSYDDFRQLYLSHFAASSSHSTLNDRLHLTIFTELSSDGDFFKQAAVSTECLWSLIVRSLTSCAREQRKYGRLLLMRLVEISNTGGFTHPLLPNNLNTTDRAKLWDLFFMILTTLEEPQAHIVRPVLSRIADLHDAVKDGSLHSIWLWKLLVFGSQHDNELIALQAAEFLLQMDSATIDRWNGMSLADALGDVLAIVSCQSLWYRFPSQSNGFDPRIVPRLAASLVDFLRSTSYGDASRGDMERPALFGVFLTTFAGRISAWSPVSVMYVCMCMARAKPNMQLQSGVLDSLGSILKVSNVYEVGFRLIIHRMVVSLFRQLLSPSLDCDFTVEMTSSLASFLAELELTAFSKLVQDFDVGSLKITGSVLENYFNGLFSKNSFQPNAIVSSAKSLVRLMLLFSHQLDSVPPQFQYFLTRSETVLLRSSVDAYLSDDEVVWCLVLYVTFLNESECRNQPLIKLVTKSVSKVVTSLLRYISRKVCESMESFNVDSAIFLQICRSFHDLVSWVDVLLSDEHRIDHEDVEDVVNEVGKTIVGSRDRCAVEAVCELSFLSSCLSLSKKLSRLSLKLVHTGTRSLLEAPKSGRDRSQLLAVGWEVLSKTSSLADDVPKLVERLVEDIAVVSNDQLSRIINAFITFVPFVESSSALDAAVSASVSQVLENRRCSEFSQAFTSVISLLKTSLVKASHSVVIASLFRCLSVDSSSPSFSHGLDLTKHILTHLKLKSGSLSVWLDMLIQLVRFGEHRDKAWRALLRARACGFASIEGSSGEMTLNALVKLRFAIFLFISSMDFLCKNSTAFGEQILRQYSLDTTSASANVYSGITRTLFRLRLVSALLIVTAFDLSRGNNGFGEKIFDFGVSTSLSNENDVLVRIYWQWLLALVVEKLPGKMLELLDLLRVDGEVDVQFSASYRCSLLSVVCHACVLLNDAAVFANVLPVILRWCVAQHTNVRTAFYAQAVFNRLWTHLEQQTEPELRALSARYQVMKNCIVSKFQPAGKPVSQQLHLHDCFLFVFSPRRDFSLETLLTTLPLIGNLPMEEVLPFSLLLDDRGSLELGLFCPVKNSTDTFLSAYESRRIENEPDQDIVSCGNGTSKFEIVQRKFPTDRPQDASALSLDLIVVASLLNLPANVGGICRTCEVFRIKELTVGNVKVTADRAFQQLSVTAERWMESVREVPPDVVGKYLSEKRDQGWIIVGVEQTCESVPLSTAKFDRKTVLLLGSEKEGIPPDLLQMVDYCVEIPQFGVIRSLNVHVSCALLIWEFFRQTAS